MDILNVLLVGLALSMDAFAVTIANCSTYKNNLTPLKEWSMPLAFAVFQGIMPLIGYFLGSIFLIPYFGNKIRNFRNIFVSFNQNSFR